MDNPADQRTRLLESALQPGWRLALPGGLDSQFRRDYFRRHLNRMRLMLALGLALYSLYAVYDVLAAPADYIEAWRIRFAAGLPVGLLSLALTWAVKSDRQMQWLYALTLLYAGLVYTAVTVLIASPYPAVYADAIALLLFINYTVIGLRFFWASFVGVAMTLSFLTGLLAAHEVPPEVVNSTIMTLIVTNLVGMTAAYFIERQVRSDFLHSELLRAQAVSLSEANLQLSSLSRTDELTGLPNRRQFNEAFAYEWGRCARLQEPLSLMMLDIDHFKKLNDRNGHDYGDRALRRIAPVLQEFARRTGDLAARLGGEEFVILLPGCRLDDAVARAEALRDRIHKLQIEHPDSELSRHLTVSVGVTGLQPTGRKPQRDILRKADQLMYAAKRSGRNRVCSDLDTKPDS